MSRSNARDIDDDVALFAAGGRRGGIVNPKTVIVGDGAVGKTCFLIAYANNSFPDDYVPTVFDNYNATVLFENRHLSVGLWDTSSGGEDYYAYRLRPLAYPETTCFLIAFSLVDPCSLENVKTKWYPELQEHAPGVPILLVAMKKDLREDSQIIRELQERDERPVSSFEGWKVAKEIGAAGYFETSAKMLVGLKDVIDEVCRITMIQEGLLQVSVSQKKRGALARLFGIGASKNPVVEYGKLAIHKCREKYEQEARREREALEEYQRTRLVESQEFCRKFVRSGAISTDIILHILHEFVLIEVKRDLPAFREDLYKLNLPKDPNSIRKEWFGVSGSSGDPRRQLLQVFCHFHIHNYSSEAKLLPKFVRGLYIGEVGQSSSSWNVLEASSRAFYSRRRHLHRIRVSVDSSQWKWAKTCGGGVKIARLELVRFVGRWKGWKEVPGELNEHFPDLRVLSLLDGRARGEDHVEIFEDGLRLPKLQSLVVSGAVNAEQISFNSFPHLTTVRIVGRSLSMPPEERLHSVSYDRMGALASVPFLRSVLFRHVDLFPSSGDLWHILSEKESLEEFMIYQCRVRFAFLDKCIFRTVPRLRVLVIVGRDQESGGDEVSRLAQTKFPPDFVAKVKVLARKVESNEEAIMDTTTEGESTRRKKKKKFWWFVGRRRKRREKEEGVIGEEEEEEGESGSSSDDDEDDYSFLIPENPGLDYVLKSVGGEMLSNLPDERQREEFVSEHCLEEY